MNPFDAWAAALPSRAKAGRADEGAPIVLRTPQTRGTDLSEWDETAAVKEAYEGNVWVYTGIQIKASAAGSVPLVIQRKTQDGEWESAQGSTGAVGQLEKLIHMPSPEHDSGDLMFRGLAMMDVTGNFLCKIQRARGDGGRPVALWPLISGYAPKRDSAMYPVAYENTGVNGDDRLLDAEEVVHWKYPNLRDHGWGLAPLKAAREVIEADNEAAEWNRVSMQNRAVVDMLLTSKFGGAGQGDRDLYKWVRQLLDDELAGAANAHRAAFVPGQWDAHQMDRSPVEMDFIDSQKFTVQKIAAVLGLLPALLSPEAATYSNMKEAVEHLWEATVSGWVVAFCKTLTRRVVPQFGLDTDEVRVMPDLSAVPALKEAMLKRVETLERLTRIGTPYDEAKALLELDLQDLPGGDEPHGLSLAARLAQFRLDRSQPQLEAGRNGGRRVKQLRPAPHPADGKQERRLIVSPLHDEAERVASSVSLRYREAVRAILDRVRVEDLRSALLSGDDSTVVAVAKLSILISELVEGAGGSVAGGAATGAASGRAALSRLVGREVTTDTGLVTRRAREIAEDAGEFIQRSSQRGLLEAVTALRSLGLDEEELARAAPLLPMLAAVNAPQAGTVAKLGKDLLEGGMDWESVVSKLERALGKAVRNRADGVGSDLGTRGVFGGQRWAGEDALTSGELQVILRMWVDSDDSRVCPECISLDEQQARNMEPYVSPLSGATYAGPPEPHPGTCRCGELFIEAVAA